MHPPPVLPRPSASATLLALVRDPAVLDRACRDVADLLAFRERRDRGEPAPLVGIWIDPRMADKLPESLHVPSACGVGETIGVRETVGVAGVWTLCWLGGDVPRDALVDALAHTSSAVSPPGEGRASPGRFVPVYRDDEAGDGVRAEVDRLTLRHPGRVSAPLYHHPGRLSPHPTKHG